MPEPDASGHDGTDKQPQSSQERGHTNSASNMMPPELLIPKNRSTSNLLSLTGGRSADKGPRLRFSFDSGLPAGEVETMSRSPVMTEHEHGLGTSGLRRIRQQPPSRLQSVSANDDPSQSAAPSRSSSMIFDGPSASRKSSHGTMGAITPGHGSPTFTEDLTRFPSESLHSFSFAHQSEEFMQNRQNVLKRSIEFMKERLGMGWPATQNAGLAFAQARVSGDQEMQSMLELLLKANLVNNDGAGLGLGLSNGAMTGPAHVDTDNIFDRSFIPRSESPENMDFPNLSPSTSRTEQHPSIAKTLEAVAETSTAGLEATSDTSRTPTNESRTTANTSPPPTRPQSLRRTCTDVNTINLQNRLVEAMAQPYNASESSYTERTLSPTLSQYPTNQSISAPHPMGHVVHGHSSRWAPAAQAIFTTESQPPYTIMAANDLACLVFGVTKAEVRKMGILEVVREERRAWLTKKLAQPGDGSPARSRSPPMQTQSQQSSPKQSSTFLLGNGAGGGVTARLLSKAPSRAQYQSRRSKTDDGAGSAIAARKKSFAKVLNHPGNKSRGVLLCGDVVPIQKRNGATGAASLWVKEKKHGLIWVLEEIHEDVATISLDDDGKIVKIEGAVAALWGQDIDHVGLDISKLMPRLPRQGSDSQSDDLDWAEVSKLKYFTCRNLLSVNIPAVVERLPEPRSLRVSSFPHIAGIMCLSSKTLEITSSNSVFSAALFGQEDPDGLHIRDVIPDFDRILAILVEEDGVDLVDGTVVPEHSFRRARAFLALRDGRSDAASFFLRPNGLPAKHRDGCELNIDVQMRVVKSDKKAPKYDEHAILEEDEAQPAEPESEVIYALWITYSRHLHAGRPNHDTGSQPLSGGETPLRQPSPGQTELQVPIDMDSDDSKADEPKKESSHPSLLTEQLVAAARKTAAKLTGVDFGKKDVQDADERTIVSGVKESMPKKTINDFVILEEMGQGAYGQVKLARHKKTGEKVVLKYVTKRRILVDTWTRDRRLGTVPLEIHVLDYLRRDGLEHPNIVEMADFFEDDVNYYIEMLPHGLPGMDLFDYIELRVNMEEAECKSIFLQVAKAIHHLHTKALVVHRDIKDENVVLDGEGNIKLIDFGSAAYIKNGPFDVFVGTIDYAAPEVLAGKPYRGKEQDVWALGILLYTIVYKENPFYSIDEIMDRDLRVPYVMSEESIDLIRGMLNRDVEKRLDIEGVMAHRWMTAED